jgi:diacylglycerol kinase (ATP)
MRVALLHNASAGSEDHGQAELSEAIRKAGHELVHLVRGVGELTAALHEEPCDLVVVAGGDGTVGRTACALAGWQVPITILPLGTANNTAMTLELSSKHEEAARSWHEARTLPYDIGLIGDGVERRRFSEAVGWGAFPSTIVKAQREATRKDVRHTLERDRELFRTTAHAASPRGYRIELDGRDVSGVYLLVEIMNVPLLGPQLPLSPASDPTDGVFELVLASEEHRPALEELARTGSVTHALPPRIERGKRIFVETSDAVMHCDGGLWTHARGNRRYEIDVEAAAVLYLAAAGT